MTTEEVLATCTEKAATLFGDRTPCCTAREAAIYLAHTGHGHSLRRIAAAVGQNPSTILRTVRRVEERRDDPLLDGLIARLEAEACDVAEALPEACDDAGLEREARRFLRRLCEPGAFLLVAEGTEKAGVFCAANKHRRPIAMLPVRLAAEFLRRDWIRLSRPGERSVRYQITEVGRAFLRRALAEDAERRGTATKAGTVSPFAAQHRAMAEAVLPDPEEGALTRTRVNIAESVLGWLARRPGPDGKPYLAPEEVEAGERLRCDFELARMGPSITQDWRSFLTPSDALAGSPVARGPGEGPAAARARVTAALGALGPGLADAALRVCCFLEGLEACEKRFGWSARSGKVVLKLALQRLADHYGLSARH
ncbi:MAG: DUF6456 domain-containing protein [Paracoccaceae bacterium]